MKFSLKIEHVHNYTSGLYRHAPGICHCMGVVGVGGGGVGWWWLILGDDDSNNSICIISIQWVFIKVQA